ncbi:acyltransferase family protein [Aquirhabdus parva]|uniref:Acyltransferase n=1 Tax=Aquirhabdus parva TaxID=2283318 RepID=A0A345P6E8_9GAMM|nr:acyltransferase [Aquirhabdus parva]AXI02857.1 acyltransferase [Aquirhabdus parva]
MSAFSPIFAFFPILVAILTASKLFKHFNLQPSRSSQFPSIDGLRGYLALCVFLHHGMIWYLYLKIGRWEAPPSMLYTNFGQIGVALFFIITGFLFSFKLIDARKKKNRFDWTQLFISRVLRLVPLYFFVMLILVLIVFILTNFSLITSFSVFVHHLMYWLGFTVFGHPDLNGVESTWVIMAGVAWSLPYEWFYYFTLPLFGFLIGLRVSALYVLLSLGIVYLFYTLPFDMVYVYYFSVGIASALLTGNKYLTAFANHKLTDYFLVILLLVTFFLFTQQDINILSIALFVFFVAITNGNTLFGILTHKLSIFLGEMSYSLYLLHGIIFFILFKLLLGFEYASAFSPIEHWGVVSICAFILVVCSFFTYTWIEAPAMQRVKYFSNLLRSRISLKSDKKLLKPH